MRNLTCALTLLAMTGCSVFDPYQREGTWRPSGAPNANIAAQIVRPSDLERGVAYAPVDSTMTAAAVTRYRVGKIRKLPDSSLSTLRLQGTGERDAGGTEVPANGAMGAP